MKKALYNLGIGSVFVGILGLAAIVLAGIWFWFTEIVPFFWVQGNYWPVIIPATFALLVVGATLVTSNKETAN